MPDDKKHLSNNNNDASAGDRIIRKSEFHTRTAATAADGEVKNRCESPEANGFSRNYMRVETCYA